MPREKLTLTSANLLEYQSVGTAVLTLLTLKSGLGDSNWEKILQAKPLKHEHKAGRREGEQLACAVNEL
jgi:hypothetical protein